MEVHPLEKLISPKSIIVAGASNNVSKMGSIQALNLMNSGFEGEIVFYHPREKTILGKPAYSKPEDLPFVPDLAMLITPTKVTPRVLDELGSAGVRRAVVVTAGFREVSEEGRVLEEELKAVADKHGIRFVGPNCIGIINTHKNLNLTVFPYRDDPGGLALVSQSGTYITQTLPYLRDRGIRLSKAVSVGNSSNVDLVDWIDYLEHDPDTKAIALYIEGVQRGKEFIASAKRVAAKKPIVALYIGGTELGSRSGMSHTGSMGGPDVLYDGIFEQAGVIRASTIDELYGWGHALASMDIPKGRRMAILTHSGGPASSMADQCERMGLLLPELSAELQGKIKPYIEPTASSRNPVDLTFSISYESFSEHLPKILMESDEIDGLLIHGLMGTGFMHELYENLRLVADVPKEVMLQQVSFEMDTIVDVPQKYAKPMIASTFMWNDHATDAFVKKGIPLFPAPEYAVNAMAALVRYGGIKRDLERSSKDGGSKDYFQSKKLKGGILNEYKSKRLLCKYGIETSQERMVESFDDALKFATDIGWPVVLKGLPEGVAHKSEAGLVHLNIASAQNLKVAWTKIEGSHAGCPKMLAKMLDGGRELLMGMTRYNGFGPVIMLGVGGIFTEAIKDVTMRAAPLFYADAYSMLDSLKLKKLFGNVRGMAELDRDLLAKALVSLSDMVMEHPEIDEVDVNPLLVVDGRPVAVDGLVVSS